MIRQFQPPLDPLRAARQRVAPAIPPRHVLAHEADRPLDAELPVLRDAQGRVDVVEVGADVVKLAVQAVQQEPKRLGLLAEQAPRGHHRVGSTGNGT